MLLIASEGVRFPYQRNQLILVFLTNSSRGCVFGVLSQLFQPSNYSHVIVLTILYNDRCQSILFV